MPKVSLSFEKYRGGTFKVMEFDHFDLNMAKPDGLCPFRLSACKWLPI